MSWATQAARATKQIDDCLQNVQTFVLPTYGLSFQTFPQPVHPATAMLYCAHESGVWNKKLKRWECLRWCTTLYPEIGLLQLTMRQGDNEVARCGVNPLDPHSHIWAAQKSFAEGIDLVAGCLKSCGYESFVRLSALHATALLLLIRSAGVGCTRGLLRAGARTALDPIRPFHSMAAWLQRAEADTTPFDGSQDTELVRLRFLWCWQCVARAAEVGVGSIGSLIGLSVSALPTGLVTLPTDFFKNVDSYVTQAKREGFCPTGPWKA